MPCSLKIKICQLKKVFSLLACIILLSYCEAQTGPGIDTLQISRNDNRYFEAEYDSKNILRFKEVPGIADSSKTLSIQFTGSESGTMLKIFNPFSEQLMYKAELYSYKKKDYIPTSTIPVYPKLISYETWPYKIDKIRLTGFRLVKE